MRGKILQLNASLAASVRAGDPDGALLQFARMHRLGLPLDGFSFTPAFSACAAARPARGLSSARQLHCLALKLGAISAAVTRTALLCAYDKCPSDARVCSSRQIVRDVLSLFDELPSRDAVSWNALISCLVRHDLAADAVATFQRMKLDGVSATGFTLSSLLKACGSLKDFRRGREIHAAIIVGSLVDAALGTALMSFYSDCGLVDAAFRVFHLHLDHVKDDVACSALMAACVSNGRQAEAFALLWEINLTATSLTTAVSACSDSSNIRYGLQVHGAAVRRDLSGRSTALCNALSDMYSRIGKLEHARHIFDETPEKDVVSWTSLIRGYGSHGRGDEAWKLFKEMTKEEVAPNSATFLSVISACAHAGMVDEGRECFALMKKHGVDPTPEHKACFIDLLGRAGRMEEAWKVFIGASEVDLGVFIAMLNACAMNVDVERGSCVAERIMATAEDGRERLMASACVALSNFFAACGVWEKVEEMRRLICGKKQIGRSSVCID